MHRDAASPRDEPDDRVPGDRGAATRELDPHIVDTFDDDAWVFAGADPSWLSRGRRLGDVFGRALFATKRRDQLANDGLRTDVAFTDAGIQRVDVFQLQAQRQPTAGRAPT